MQYPETIVWFTMDEALPSSGGPYLVLDDEGNIITGMEFNSETRRMYRPHPNHPQNEVRSGWYLYECSGGTDYWREDPVAWASYPKGPVTLRPKNES